MSFTKWTMVSIVVLTLSFLGGAVLLCHRAAPSCSTALPPGDCRASGRRQKRLRTQSFI